MVTAGDVVSRDAMSRRLARADGAAPGPRSVAHQRAHGGGSLRLRELYANQSSQEAWIALPYASAGGAAAGRLLSVFRALAFWLGLVLFLRPDPRLPLLRARVSLGIAGAGLLLVLTCVGFYGLGMLPALLVSLALVAGTTAWYGRRRLALPAPMP